MNFFRKMSLIPRGLRYKLLIAFCLMSVIPLLVALYLVRDQIFSPKGDIISVSWVLFFSVVLTLLGLFLAKQMVEPVIAIAVEARLIADGDINRQIRIETEDEIGDLGRSINEITVNIKEKIEELKSYGEKTKLINIDIHKKVLALSSLLQIGENISGFAQLEDIMSLIVEKVNHLSETGYVVLFLPKASDPLILEIAASSSLTNSDLRGLEMEVGKGFLGNALLNGIAIYSDSNTKASKQVEDFKKKYNIKNFAAIPIVARKKAIGLLLIGNDVENFAFADEDMDVIKIFTRQAAIAYESAVLTKRAKELEIKDDLTGLYNEKYIEERLEDEIKRAMLYQRPCSYLVFNVDDFDKFRAENGELATEEALKKISSIITKDATEIGKVARLSGDVFALLLPEKNKREAYAIAEDVRREVESAEFEGGKIRHLTISGGVGENPIDGMNAAELIRKASMGVYIAKTQGKNRII